jgi:hypothetical protein
MCRAAVVFPVHGSPTVRNSVGCLIINFTIFEGTSEIQRLIIGRAATGLDVR